MGCHVKDLLTQLSGLSCFVAVGQLHPVHAVLEAAPLVLASLQADMLTVSSHHTQVTEAESTAMPGHSHSREVW